MNRVSLSMNDERVLEYLRTQHAVKIWVEDVLNIPLVGEDLRFGLKNGVILCYLIQEIEPGSVPTIHENTQQVFKLKENVENFIAGVSEYGVPRHKLFAVNDLFDGANMPRVIECLAWLGKISEDHEFSPPFSAALQEAESFDPQMPTGETLAKLRDQLKQIKEPPRTARKSAFGTSQNNPLSNSDLHQLKRKLRESEILAQPTPVVVPSIPKPEIPVVSTIPVVVEPPKKVPEVVVPTIQTTPVIPVTVTQPQTTPSPPVVVVPTPTPVPVPTPAVVKPPQPVVPKEQGPSAAELQKVRERQEAEVKKLNSGVSKFQAAFRGWRQRKLYKERRRHAAFRDKVAKELLKTERDYVTSLDACIQNYHKPLHDAVSGIKNKDAKVHIGKDSLTRDQLRAIFSDIHIIWEFNSQLLGDISARVDTWYPNQRIGGISKEEREKE